MRASSQQTALTVSAVGLFLFASTGVLYLGRTLFVPITAAVLASMAVQPVLRRLHRRVRMPSAIPAALAVLLVTTGVGSVAIGLAGPATRWMHEAPAKLAKIETRLRELREPVEQMSRAAEQLEEITTVGPTARGTTEVRLETPSFVGRMVEGTGTVLFSLGTFVVFLYFLLLSSDGLLRKLVRLSPRLERKKSTVAIFRDIESALSRYLLTITCINATLAIVVGFTMAAIGLPEAVQVGLMVGLFNFVPYIGPVAGTAVTAVLALLHEDALVRALVAPALVGGITVLEGYFVTPWILGRGMMLSPILVLSGVLLWGALWGAPGAVMAVPLLVGAKIVCDHWERLRLLGELLGR